MSPPAGDSATRSDLRIVPLLAEAEDVVPDLTADEVRSSRRPTGGSAVADLFGGDDAFGSLIAAMDEYGDLLAVEQGKAAIAQIHAAPRREVHLDDEVHLLSHLKDPTGTSVVHVVWQVERAENRALRAGRLSRVDEFAVPAEALRLQQLLRELARCTGYCPAQPRVHGVLLATERARAAAGDLVLGLHAAAAVADVAMRELAVGDPSDPVYLRELDRSLAANNHHVLIALHDREKWVWARFKNYQERVGRAAIPLDPSLPEAALATFQAAALNLAELAPSRPTVAWGRDAVQRAKHRTGPGFELSPRALGHLERNGYPDVERMLGFLERLADMAQAYHVGDMPSQRIADWAHSEFAIEIALHDDNISEADAYFTVEGVTLCNRPHVKVDDYKNAAECGRIYFGLDDEKRQVVVDHVGLHNRY